MNTRAIGITLVIVVLLAIGGYYFLHMKSSSGAPAQSQPETKDFTLKVVDKKLVEGPSTLTVKQGDIVNIHITNDGDEELHLHGYDMMVDLATDTEATLTFTANASGHFPFELEHSSTELGAVEVQP